MCNCGCNTCETKKPTLMLNENLAPRTILSEGLKHHIDTNKPLTEHLYRAGSRAYFDLFAEARSLYSRGILEFTNEDDLALLTETNLGHFGMFEGKKVPLDFPIELNEQMDIYDEIANMEFGMDYDQLGDNEKEWVRDEIDNMEMRESLNESDSKYPNFDLNKNIKYKDTSISSGMWRYTGQEQGGAGVYRNLNNGQILAFDKNDFDIFKNNLSSHFDINEGTFNSPNHIAIFDGPDGMVDVYKTSEGFYFQTDNYDGEASNAKEAAKWLKDNGFVRLQAGSLDEAKKKKAKKKDNRPIGKPMRSSSGGKAYKVYVKDPKTKKIKTVRFGSGGLRAKINDSKARAAFAKRHKCSTKKDRTKAGYWSCRLPRYAKLLGLKSSFSGFW